MGIKVTIVKRSPNLDTLVNKAKEMHDSQLGIRVGWLAKNAYPPYVSKKGKSSGKSVTVATVAAISEEGYPEKKIPKRPTLKPTAKREKRNWSTALANEVKQYLNNKQSLKGAYEAVGIVAVGQVKKTITQITSPPLKKATIAARKRQRANKSPKGSLTKPLVNFGILLNTCTSEVGKE